MSSATLRRLSAHAAVVLSVAAIVALATPALAVADAIYVDVMRGSDGTGTGASGRPYRSIRKGLSVAGSGDEVRVAAGTYSVATGEIYPLVVPTGVKLLGDRTPLTMLDSLRGTTIDGDDVNTTIRIVAGNANTVVDDIFFEPNASATDGGAIRIEGGSLPGGGPVVTDCFFLGNSAITGGAIRIEKGGWPVCEPLIERCYFVNDSAAGNGGAICSVNAVPQVRGCYFLGCSSATGDGGAISLGGDVAEATFSDCTIAYCSAPAGLGGGIYSEVQPLAIRETTFVACSSGGGGAVSALDAIAPYATLTMENCVLLDNTVVGPGGAVYALGTSTAIRNCTMTGNTATGAGGGIAQNTGSLAVSNCVLWDNDDDIAIAGGVSFSLQHSCVEDADTGTGVIHADPMLSDLGGTPRLLPGSPCVDTGSNAAATAVDREGRPRPADGDGNGTVVADMGAYERSPYVERASGPDRYATAVAASQKHFDVADYVVLATGLAYPDALCAAPLAGIVTGPVLLTRPDALPTVVSTELERLGTEKVYIVGGESAVSGGVADALKAAGYEIERLSGATRYNTSQAVAQEVAELLGTNFADLVLVARGDAFPDALSASSFAAWTGVPILLTQPDQLPTSTMNCLSDLGFADAIVVGGTAAVSDYVVNQIDVIVSGGVQRVSGDDRYETSVAFARFVDTDPRFLTAWKHDYIGMATGSNFPDALCGGPICGAMRGPLLLTRPGELTPGAASYITDYEELVAQIEVFGGSSAVSDAVLATTRALLP